MHLASEFDIRNTVPVVDGKPIFTPGSNCYFYGWDCPCLAFAGVSLALGFPSKVPISYLPVLKLSGYAIGIILLFRAIG